MDVNPIEPPDRHYLSAAEGWLELGLPEDASAELARITPVLLNHPDVLRVRFALFGRTGKWDLALQVGETMVRLYPDRSESWISRSNAFHFLQRYQEAYDHLIPALNTFPDCAHLRYNLACFCCRMGRLDEARTWLRKAFAIKGSEELRLAALEDPDMEPLRDEIFGLKPDDPEAEAESP